MWWNLGRIAFSCCACQPRAACCATRARGVLQGEAEKGEGWLACPGGALWLITVITNPLATPLCAEAAHRDFLPVQHLNTSVMANCKAMAVEIAVALWRASDSERCSWDGSVAVTSRT